MVEGEIYDKYRHLELSIESWLYYVEEPSIKIQPTTNIFPYEGDLPFTNNRKQWRYEVVEIIIKRLTQAMINEFGNRGICKQSNETQCSPSINWDYEIIKAVFHYKPGCANEDIRLYKEIKERIQNDKIKIERYQDEYNKIDIIDKDKRTKEQKDRIRYLKREINRLNKVIISDEEQLRRLETKCPSIKELSE